MKAISKRFQGVFAFVVTPTKNDGGELDLDALRWFLDFQIESGVDGITVFGSTGGIGSFTEQERQKVIETAARHINSRVPLVAGTGSIQTQESIRLTKFAQDVGADAALVVPITYWPLTDDELYGHFEAIAGAVKIPVGIYNNPGTTGVDIKPALVGRIAEIDNIALIKESSGDMARITAIAARTNGALSILNGNDATTPAAIAAGVHGWFAGSCSIMPKHCVELFRIGLKEKNLSKLQDYFVSMYPICEFMGMKGYIRVAHAACDILGHSMGDPRRPIRSLDAKDSERLKLLLANAGLVPSKDGLLV